MEKGAKKVFLKIYITLFIIILFSTSASGFLTDSLFESQLIEDCTKNGGDAYIRQYYESCPSDQPCIKMYRNDAPCGVLTGFGPPQPSYTIESCNLGAFNYCSCCVYKKCCKCKNLCEQPGKQECLSDNSRFGYKICGNYDKDDCLEWSLPVSCKTGEICYNGFCCKPNCEGKECGDDGCGGECQSKCGENQKCLNNKCVSKVCREDDCGENCGGNDCSRFGSNYLCINNKCIECKPECEGKTCGQQDGCGGICTFCSEDSICDINLKQCIPKALITQVSIIETSYDIINDNEEPILNPNTPLTVVAGTHVKIGFRNNILLNSPACINITAIDDKNVITKLNVCGTDKDGWWFILVTVQSSTKVKFTPTDLYNIEGYILNNNDKSLIVQWTKLIEKSTNLYQDIKLKDEGLKIISEDIILDCQGHKIIGNGFGSGISVLDKDNIKIINCIITNFSKGITFSRTEKSEIINNMVFENINEGIFFYNSQNNKIYDSIIIKNDYGIYVIDSSNNIIYNNFFNNKKNAYDSSSTGNFWNVTKSCKTENIIHGQCVGGNYWHDYTGEDDGSNERLRGDKIGDTELPYNSNGNILVNGDWLPLVYITETPFVPPISEIRKTKKSSEAQVVQKPVRCLDYSTQEDCQNFSLEVAYNTINEIKGFGLCGSVNQSEITNCFCYWSDLTKKCEPSWNKINQENMVIEECKFSSEETLCSGGYKTLTYNPAKESSPIICGASYKKEISCLVPEEKSKFWLYLTISIATLFVAGLIYYLNKKFKTEEIYHRVVREQLKQGPISKTYE